MEGRIKYYFDSKYFDKGDKVEITRSRIKENFVVSKVVLSPDNTWEVSMRPTLGTIFHRFIHTLEKVFHGKR